MHANQVKGHEVSAVRDSIRQTPSIPEKASKLKLWRRHLRKKSLKWSENGTVWSSSWRWRRQLWQPRRKRHWLCRNNSRTGSASWPRWQSRELPRVTPAPRGPPRLPPSQDFPSPAHCQNLSVDLSGGWVWVGRSRVMSSCAKVEVVNTKYKRMPNSLIE